MIPSEDYVRKATVVRVIDGDTIKFNIDLGFGIWRLGQSVRLLGIDCPEVRGPTKKAGLLAKAAVVGWLNDSPIRLEDGTPVVIIQTVVRDTDNFGRTLAKMWRPGDQQDLSAYLLEKGFAIPSKGVK